MKLSEIYSNLKNEEEFVKHLGEQISKDKGYSFDFVLEYHSSTKTPYLAKLIFTDKNKTKRYLSILLINKTFLYFVRKFTTMTDWSYYFSENSKVEWAEDYLRLPMDEYMFSVVDISSLSKNELISMISIHDNFNTSQNKDNKDVYSVINDYESEKQMIKAKTNQIKQLQEEILIMSQKNNIVSKIIVPMAVYCQEILKFDSFELSKNETSQGLRINIVLLKNEQKKRLGILFKDDYPFQITGINKKENMYQLKELPQSFEELAQAFI